MYVRKEEEQGLWEGKHERERARSARLQELGDEPLPFGRCFAAAIALLTISAAAAVAAAAAAVLAQLKKQLQAEAAAKQRVADEKAALDRELEQCKDNVMREQQQRVLVEDNALSKQAELDALRSQFEIARSAKADLEAKLAVLLSWGAEVGALVIACMLGARSSGPESSAEGLVLQDDENTKLLSTNVEIVRRLREQEQASQEKAAQEEQARQEQASQEQASKELASRIAASRQNSKEDYLDEQ
eukprot:SM000062S19910  [mRNA]  locus=s62:339136:340802:+ [translate_table: standard]